MGFLRILRKVKIREKEVRILVLGLDNSGKTSIIKRLSGGSDSDVIENVSPTLGFEIKTFDYTDDTKINFWDVGGQKSIRSYWRNYFESTDGIVWVVDAADDGRFIQSQTELFELLNAEKLAGASLLVLINKTDLVPPGPLQVEGRLKEFLAEKASNRHWNVVRCSAFNGTGLVDGINWIIEDISSRIFMFD